MFNFEIFVPKKLITMKSNEIKAKGTRLLEIVSTLILVFGIIAGLLLISEGGKSTDSVPVVLLSGFSVLFGSLLTYAFALNIININTNLEKLKYFRTKDYDEKSKRDK